MTEQDPIAIAVVGVGAIMPDASDTDEFWHNITQGRYCISDVDPDRWDPALYYDPDPSAPDKTYSRIGGWVRDFAWDPLAWRLPVPPRVAEQMDDGQKWAVNCARAALVDYGWPEKPLDTERTAVIIGNALAGEKHYRTALRVAFPEFARELERAPHFAALPTDVRTAIETEAQTGFLSEFPEITEDTMPGELANIIAGRVANLFNLRGPNYTTDAACASALAAIAAGVQGLLTHEFDTVLTGGVDRNMGVHAFIKFCKIGALSATGTRPYGEGADGFVMGEGAALFLLKRLADAERDGDRVYAVLRGVAGSSDGRGKGITAPNPVGQRLAVERAWAEAGIDPATATMIEGHGTSTRVGDVVEVESLASVFGGAGAGPGSIALGSVKSNLGHLKGAAGAAGMLKTVLALHHKLLPPSLHARTPNPDIDFEHTPFRVNHELCPWDDTGADGVRRAGLSAFGFGGTNFHVVFEEHVPGRITGSGNGRRSAAVPPESSQAAAPAATPAATKAPLRGALLIGAPTRAALVEQLEAVQRDAIAGVAPPPAAPMSDDLRAAERIAIDYGNATELAASTEAALKALALEERADATPMWKALRARGVVHRGQGAPAKVAFLYTGQGSQYANMLATLRATEPIVARTFDEADAIMTPLLGKPLSEYIFVDPEDAEAMARAEISLRETEITQPAVMAADLALTRLLAAYGISPDMAMGHSLGEYGALMAAGSLSFEHTLEAVSARGREMAGLTVEDRGVMAAVFAPMSDVEAAVAGADGCIIANVNSNSQAVIGGATEAVRAVMQRLIDAGYMVIELPVSHAFHTSIVAPVSAPLRAALTRLGLQVPRLPIVSNVTGELYPSGDGALEQALDLLSRQVASPVQFVQGLRTLHREGARVFIEVGPKKALQGFAEDVLGADPAVVTLFANHPKTGDIISFNQALCGLYAAGLGAGVAGVTPEIHTAAAGATPYDADRAQETAMHDITATSDEYFRRIGRLVDDLVTREHTSPVRASAPSPGATSVVLTGAALGLPGREHVFDDGNLATILDGDQCIDVIPARFRDAMLDKHITRLVKSEHGDPTFETISDPDDVIKLAARRGALDLVEEFGIDRERVLAFDTTTKLAIGAGIDALRDAGIPLVLSYRTTSTGSRLPERYELPESLRDNTGIIFASAFPGSDALIDEVARYHEDRARRARLAELRSLRERMQENGAGDSALAELDHHIHQAGADAAREPYEFDRRFLFRVLSMGHSQFGELIGARGPNTQINAACASTTQALALAQDWISQGRCRRVVVIAADDVTSDHMLEWAAAGFLASGAAATDGVVEEAALPFDRRRHGMLIGMGAAAIVVEAEDAARERGITPICDVLATVTANSAFHGTRLDVHHITQMMEDVVSRAERASGVDRSQIARELLFVSHETYTPARGGSASAEVEALRTVFGTAADEVLIANTKGFTGHPMGVGIEDVIAVKALETGIVPPVPNFREVDPQLGTLRLSKGGAYPLRYALRLAAGFGSQISLVLLRWADPPAGRRRAPDELGYAYRVADGIAWNGWLARVSGRPDAQLEVVKRTLRVHEERTVAPPATPQPQERARVPERASGSVPAPEPQPVQPPPAASPPEEPVQARPAAAAVMASVSDVPPVSEALPVSEAAVRARVLALVAEKTGYPEDMLDVDLDLEADLGVDTVKQAELFSVIRESYGIARDDTLRLRDLPTLAHVIRFVVERVPCDGAAAPEPAPPAGASGVSAEAVRARVLALVAEKTGYPEDMLDVDLDLEADLGVDTVKQAELFSVIRETYGIPRDDTLRLRDLPTLAHVIRFVVERAPQGQGSRGPAAPLATEAPEPATEPSPRQREGPGFDAADSVPRRVPAAVPRPPITHFAATSVRLDSDSRVVIGADHGGAAGALQELLQARGVTCAVVDPAVDAAALSSAIQRFAGGGRVTGLYWLAALDVEPTLRDLDVDTWREGLRLRVKQLYTTVRALETLGSSDTFVLGATRLGGRHGYDEPGATAPMGGAVTGFTKALARERPDMLAKAVDHGAGDTPATIARRLIDETLRDPAVVEVGYALDTRWTVSLVERAAKDGGAGMTLGPSSVFVLTGAAGGIVSAITADLAAASGATFHLLDLIPAPSDDPDLDRIGRDRDALKRELVERLRASGDRVTPALVDRRLAAIERQAAARDAIRAVEAAGGSAHYHSVDLTDDRSVAAIIDDIRGTSGHIDVLVHAAGLEVSRMLPDKTPGEFDLVFDVKTDGWFSLVHAAREMPIGALVVFSSVAGRFGNAGQTDYSAANDLLCKLTSALRRTRPDTRAIAIDWTAWDRIGMATRGSVPTMMARAGIDMMQPEAGIPTLRRELCAGATRGEVVIAGKLGVLLEERSVPAAAGDGAAGTMLMAQRLTRSEVSGPLVISSTLDPAQLPFLDDHRIEGIPVLPGVMSIEALAEAALIALPAWRVVAVENVDFVAPLKFYRDEPRDVTVEVLYDLLNDHEVLARCVLIGSRTLAGQAQAQTTVHTRGVVRLARAAAADVSTEARAAAPGATPSTAIVANDIYRVYFHGPAYRVLEAAWRDGDSVVGTMSHQLPAEAGHDHHFITAPRLNELCFQTAGIRDLGVDGVLALPAHVDAVSVLPSSAATDTLRFHARARRRADGGIDAEVADAGGALRARILGYRTTPLPMPVSEALLGPFRRAVT